MDKDTRKLWKTFPWFGIGVTALMAFLSVRSILTGRVRFEDTRSQDGPKYVNFEDQPIAYALILLMLVVFFTAGLAYCVFRIRRRNQFRREDDILEKDDSQIS